MNAIDQALTSFYLFLNWEPYTWFALFVAVNLLDALTTIKALKMGGREINPLMALVMRQVGVTPALLILKGAMLYWVFSHLGLVILYLPLFVLVYAGVCAWNLRVIARLSPNPTH